MSKENVTSNGELKYGSTADEFKPLAEVTLPEPMLGGGTAVTLEICCDLINQLFPEKKLAGFGREGLFFSAIIEQLN